jgi:DNA helicase-2/ATP-dependent DNA helicase PcrA
VSIARVPLNDIIFKLITWLPDFQNDIEHLAWLEAVQRGVSAAAVLQGFGGDVIFDKSDPFSDIAVASLKQVYRRILIPIADGILDVSEDVLETLPMDRVNIMTIHQAKGLEFPITIVDVGTAMQDLRWMTARNRYPNHPDTPHLLEDAFRPFSNINLPLRSGRDRAFDDLVRSYFVAFSRAQDVLILAGHTYSYRDKPTGTKACHVGSGWIRPSPDAQNLWPWENQPMLTLLEDEYL